MTQQQKQAEGEVDERLEELRKTFSYFDKNQDGTISVKEFDKVFRALGRNPTEKEIKEMISLVDADKNGKMNFEEFRKFVEKYKCTQTPTEREADLRAAFRIIDRNNSGYISSGELRKMMKAVGEELTDEEIKEMMDIADIDKDDKISYDEFVKTMAS